MSRHAVIAYKNAEHFFIKKPFQNFKTNGQYRKW